MQSYELTAIISPDVTEEGISNLLERMTEFVTQSGGTIIKTDRWGKRKLAYPIQHYREGDYVVVQLELEPSKTAELEDSLKRWEELIRHLLVKLGA